MTPVSPLGRQVPIAVPPIGGLEALQAADDRLLVASLVHLTGDTRWMGEPYRSVLTPPATSSGGLLASESDSARPIPEGLDRVRRTLRAAIADHLVPQPPPRSLPDDGTLSDLAEFVTGTRLGPGYLSKLKQELTPATGAPDRPAPTTAPTIVIIGAGLSGLSMAIRLRELDLAFRILERHQEAGGVWLENSYPGCGVDSPNHVYSFSRAINLDWTRYFAGRDEILGYVRATVERFGLLDCIDFGTEVRKMSWSDSEHQWRIELSTSDGESVMMSDVVIPAVGTLNQPKRPEIAGIDDFRGPTFHTARWRDDVELKGQRVGLIGNGSSGFQVGPHLAAAASHLTSFQRSPAWTAPNPSATSVVPDQVRWVLRHVPYYAEWHRFSLYWSSGDAGYTNLVVDPDWDGPGISAANEQVRRQLTRYIRSQLEDRPDLQAELLPDYPPFTKRMVVDNGWLASLTRPNVDLVTEEIVQATPSGLLTADGTHHDLDVIVFATGFHGTRFLWPTEVRGRSGRTPAELAGQDDDIRAYLGTVMPDFPNMFSIFGPNSSIGHGGSAIHVAECQADYVTECVLSMMRNDIRTMECRADVCADYNRIIDRDLEHMVWTEPGIASRYRNQEGRIVTNHPWTLQHFWDLTRLPDLADYHIVHRSAE